MTTIRTKICGITRTEDALIAEQLGVDAIGLVFYPKSKRAINIEQAQRIIAPLSPFLCTVGLFVNEKADVIHQILSQVPIQILQFHGDETDEFCQQFSRPYLKAIRVQNMTDIQTAYQQFPHATALLFDAYQPHEYGGTGKSFDWRLLPKHSAKPWILAGGLTPENVKSAIQISGATAVDVSGGVESSAGIKDKDKMIRFLNAIA